MHQINNTRFYIFFEFIGVVLLQKILEEKIIRTHYLSSYYCHLMTLPRFVGSAVGDCRNSGTSEFIRIVKRQSGVPVRHARREDMKYPNLGRIEKTRLQ